ncbi:hypothetical protein RclHR1_00120037 [Rhizophagus clarus]|uniref:Uncharacterized protein n=1 Tax=Rhizophagus clarus TaxID=94130 RepID=A0A2Z6Q5Y2_9GLOM|nr:hypothetical protein RclHR1_00120037 [Rhizophagus clarus]GES93486.1 hypothetical protein GLOIN_2v1712194 [Rhizophagus clarus]
MNTRIQVVRVAGLILVPLQLIAVVYLINNISKSSWPVREQQRSNFTGLPIWFNAPCPSTHSVDEKTPVEYIEFGSTIITGVASLICIYKGILTYLDKKDTLLKKLADLLPCNCLPIRNTRNTRSVEGSRDIQGKKFGTIFLFDNIITTYVIATFIPLVVGLIFSVGKLWALFGIFHNVLEVFIVAALCYKKTIKYVSFTFIFVSVYSVVVTGVVGRLPWYWDAMFFKFQGLILDFILPVLFYIMPRKGTNGESQPLMNEKINPLPHVSYLILAAFVHLLGNLADVVGGDSESSVAIFRLSYFVTFPLYAIYVYDQSEGGESKGDFLSANITISDFILLILWGATASATVTLIGINNIRCP